MTAKKSNYYYHISWVRLWSIIRWPQLNCCLLDKLQAIFIKESAKYLNIHLKRKKISITGIDENIFYICFEVFFFLLFTFFTINLYVEFLSINQGLRIKILKMQQHFKMLASWNGLKNKTNCKFFESMNDQIVWTNTNKKSFGKNKSRHRVNFIQVFNYNHFLYFLTSHRFYYAFTSVLINDGDSQSYWWTKHLHVKKNKPALKLIKSSHQTGHGTRILEAFKSFVHQVNLESLLLQLLD